MNDLPSIPWEKIFANSIWILGVSIILASSSYHECLAHLQKTKRGETFKRASYKKPFLFGLILVTSGISLSIHNMFSAVITGVAALLLIIWFFKIIRNQAVRRKN